MIYRSLIISALLAALPHPAAADTQVNVVGLFAGKAVIIVNGGKPVTLSAGQSSPEGVRLLSADSGQAVLQVEGKRKVLGMGQAATVAGGAEALPASAVLYADSAGHHSGEGQFNGRMLKYVVDTGATLVSMNSGDAKYAGIDYKKGKPVTLQTANGNAVGYLVIINSVKLGGVTLNQVEGVVNEGGSPPIVLLGMSALNRLEMKREGIALTLTKKY